ncbi:MAG: hypothetical protein LUH15_17170 [Tannerellaceae bacterium]|nr:hypothetical protein [Tannerellaceae bacterium]
MTHIIFEFCCDIIAVIANLVGWSYKEANVYIFIWLQPALVILSALLFAIACMKYNIKMKTPGSTLLNIMGISLLIFYIIIGIQIIFRYNIPPDDAFILAQQDMIRFGKPIGANYEHVNFVLFVFGMPGIILINWIGTYRINKRYRNL